MSEENKKESVPETIKLNKSLKCVLTQEEKVTKGEQMGTESQLYQKALDRKKEVNTQLSADVESHRAAMQLLGSLLANGYEYRSIQCERVIDRKTGVVITTRIDTGEIIEKRALNQNELQGTLKV